MFINLEVWEEEHPERYGNNSEAHLDMRALKLKKQKISIVGIVSYENIRIWTVGRPNTNDNKGDVLEGIRLLLADGSTRVVIDDKDPTFEQVLILAKKTEDLVYEYGDSNYIARFLRNSA